MVILLLACVPELVPPLLLENPDHDFDGDGVTESEGDCNDDAAAAFPGATEVCGDGVDNDCDGTPNECAPHGEVPIAEQGHFLWVGEDLGDTGWSVAGMPDIDGDGFTELIVGIPGFHRNTTEDVGAILAWTRVIDEDVRTNAGSWGAPLDTPVRFGTVVGDAGDFTGDGTPDVICTGPGADGGIAGVFTGILDDGFYLSTQGVDADEELGFSAVGAGDLDDDGKAEMLVGAPGWGEEGAVRILYGTRAGEPETTLLTGSVPLGRVGEAVLAPGDLDGDGQTDLLIGAPNLASVWHLGSAPDSDAVIADVGARIEGPADSAAGRALASAGDVDGDGLVDVAVGAPDRGSVYILLSPPSGLLEDAWAVLEGPGEDAGAALATPADYDNDGHLDLAVGAPLSDRGASEGGAVYLFGRVNAGRAALADADAILVGGQPGEHTGASIGLAGDVDHDGFVDLAVGAPFMEVEERVVGGVYLVLGGGGY